MYPCSACHRHLRDADLLGALTLLLLGATACSKDPVSATTTSESGSTSTTDSTTTTVSDTSDTNVDTSTSTDTSDTVDETTLTFNGGGADFVSNECDPFMQDCPDGEKCVPYASIRGGSLDANMCVTILGDGQPGDPCISGGNGDATDDCGAESFCWDTTYINGEQVGVCTEFCQGTADDPSCPPGTGCFIANDGSTNLCLSTCDPVMQDCDLGLACYFTGAAFVCIATSQDLPLGEPCSFINDCAGGLTCLDANFLPTCDDAACCGSFCSVMAGEPCVQMGTECTSIFQEGMAPIGYEDVGVCILPGA